MTDNLQVQFLAGASPSVAAFRKPLIALLQAQGIDQKWWLNEPHAGSETLLDQMGVPRGDLALDRGAINPARDFPAILRVARIILHRPNQIIVVYSLKLIIYAGLLGLILWPFLALRGVRLAAFIPGLGYALNKGHAKSRKQAIIQGLTMAVCRVAFLPYSNIVFTNSDNRPLIERLAWIRRKTTRTTVPGAGVDLQRFPKTARPAHTDVVRFIFVGRLLADKGVIELFDAVNNLRQTYPDRFSLSVVGAQDTSDLTSLNQDLFDDALASGHIELVGRKDDVGAEFAKAHVGVLPSYHEVSGISAYGPN